MDRVARLVVAVGLAMASAGSAWAQPVSGPADYLHFPAIDGLVASADGARVAWVRNVDGQRTVYVARAPGFVPAKVADFAGDDGQELTGLVFSPDGQTLAFVRGGDHDANYAAAGGFPPAAASSPEQPRMMIWRVDLAGSAMAQAVTEGDAPVLSADGRLAFVRDGVVYTIGRKDKDASRLFFDRGKDHGLAWSPDGNRLLFVSERGDHSFIGVYSAPDQPLRWLAPSIGQDGDAAWSPDGRQIAYTHVTGYSGPPALTTQRPEPWTIRVADAATGVATTVWASGPTLRDSYPDVTGGANLHWAGADGLTFLSTADNWPHLYALALTGAGAGGKPGAARLLTPGAFMVEHVGVGGDGQTLFYSANTGATPHDDDRSHIWRVVVQAGAPVAVTHGEGLEWEPVALASGVAFVGATAQAPCAVAIADTAGTRVLAGQDAPAQFPQSRLITPRAVTFVAPDGLTIHGQLFEGAGAGRKAGLVFVHGGPSRQMLLGWSYMRYYSNAYAMNQYFAAHGFTVLSVNYRRGIGYGHDFQHPAGGGWRGSSEYQDVLAGGRYLQSLPAVDPARIGIWGGSYGGLLTALALARNSGVFAAGVDFHGVHDWSLDLGDDVGGSAANGLPYGRYEQGDRDAGMKLAFESSAMARIADWTSPVLFIHGDDDHNVRFDQTVDMERRLLALGKAPVEDLILPNEVHDFLRAQDWVAADRAMAEFLARKLSAR